MKIRDVLIIGAGIAGCAAALALVKRGVAVTIVTSVTDERVYHSSFIPSDHIEEVIGEFKQMYQEKLCSSQAFLQLESEVKKSVDELLKPNLNANRNTDVHRCLKEQLDQYDSVEWLSHHTLVELLTLDHSLKRSDIFKKPSCLGGLLYNHETNGLERILAKETILATGGAASLYPYSLRLHWACGQGLAIAHRAGTRILNMDKIQFRSCSGIDAYRHIQGFNSGNDPLTVVSVASFTCGGIAVDKNSQTNIQRLRAIGEVACTGLFYDDKDEQMAVLESLTWAVACAEDIAKQLSRFVYCFPELREVLGSLEASSTIVEEDWTTLRQVMWSYVGIHRTRASLERAKGILEQLFLANTPDELTACSIDQIQLFYAIQTAQFITHSALAQWNPTLKQNCNQTLLSPLAAAATYTLNSHKALSYSSIIFETHK